MHLSNIISISMTTNNIDNLTQQLSQIRIRRERTIREVESASAEESLLLRRLHTVRSAIAPTELNPYKHGNKVWITNRLREEDGIVGVITSKSTPRSRFLDIWDPTNNKRYTQGWWNLNNVTDEAQ